MRYEVWRVALAGKRTRLQSNHYTNLSTPNSLSHLKFLVHFFVTISDLFVNLSSLTYVASPFPTYLLNLNSFVLSGLSARGVECVGGVACKRGTTDRADGSYFNNRSEGNFQATRDGTHARILSYHASAGTDVLWRNRWEAYVENGLIGMDKRTHGHAT